MIFECELRGKNGHLQLGFCYLRVISTSYLEISTLTVLPPPAEDRGKMPLLSLSTGPVPISVTSPTVVAASLVPSASGGPSQEPADVSDRLLGCGRRPMSP